MVVFCFSKRRCDSLVDSLASLDMTSADDKSDIQVKCGGPGFRRAHGRQNLLCHSDPRHSSGCDGIGVRNPLTQPWVTDPADVVLLKHGPCANAPAATHTTDSSRRGGAEAQTLLPRRPGAHQDVLTHFLSAVTCSSSLTKPASLARCL